MSGHYVNNLTSDFSPCFSEHLTGHPNKIRFDDANCTNVRGIVLLLAVPKLNIAELRLTDVLPKEYKEMLLKAVRDAESDISGLEGDTPILALFPVRFTTN